MRLNQADHDVDALSTQLVRVFQHSISLPDARRMADVNTQACLLARLDLGQQGFRRRSLLSNRHGDHGFRLSRSRLSSSTFTRDSPRKPKARSWVCAFIS